MNFFNYLKNIFLILIMIQFAPTVISGIKKQYFQFMEPHTSVAIIPIKGLLYNSTSYVRQLQKFFKDPSIKAILIKMECSGTATGTGQSIYNEIIQLKKLHPKPIIVLVENTCASGGYLIACACDYIIAPSMAMVGSIGVTLPFLFQVKDFIENNKIHYIPITAGKYKGTADPFVDLTPDQKNLLQDVVNDSYNEFTHMVMQSRKLSNTNIEEWADGKIFTGNQALKLGLIDEVGSASNAVNIIKEKAIIEGEIEWVHETSGGIRSLLLGNESDDDDTTLLSSAINQACTILETRYGKCTQLHS